jgi:hypothetical protein
LILDLNFKGNFKNGLFGVLSLKNCIKWAICENMVLGVSLNFNCTGFMSFRKVVEIWRIGKTGLFDNFYETN